MRAAIRPEFVEFIPRDLAEGVLYISREYSTAVHLCCCGCGQRVVTPLSPVGWRLTTSGPLATLYPSIGNWSFPCRSHYWIRRNQIVWSYQLTDDEIASGRARDAHARDEFIYSKASESATEDPVHSAEAGQRQIGFLQRVKRWLFG